MEDSLIRKLMTSVKCESCGQYYEADDVDVLGHREDMWFLKLHCSNCHTQCLLAAVVRESRLSGTVAGLMDKDPAVSGGSAITADDLLEMRGFLKDFDGDFSRLFA